MNAFVKNAQSVGAGDALVFDGMNYASNGCWCRSGGWLFAPQATGQFTITKPGVYRILFTAQAQVAAAGVIEMEIRNAGAGIPGTQMAENAAVADAPHTMAAACEIVVPCGGNAHITVTNTGAEEITVTAASLVIDRIG